MILNYDEKIIQVKIVYYGPAMSGKTTSIKYLFNYFNKEEQLNSIDNSVGRTLFFDFGVLEFKGAEWNLKLLIYSATGQDFYSSTRPATLKGVDGIIFVVDSKRECLDHNFRSWKELEYYFDEELYQIPIVIALNKYDLGNGKKISETDLNQVIDFDKFKSIYIAETIAITGEGLLYSFKKLIQSIFPKISLNL
ncbi:MAG: Small GTP-binding domain protein [Promethearchaeota archaeon]|nr:MAG: Small GTP-binding domain protein [Candidatus Lokiarchaeota archaeon]